MEAILISQFDGSSIIPFLIAYTLFSIAAILLEVFLNKKDNKLLGLVPLLITFLPTIPYLLSSVQDSFIGYSVSAFFAFMILLVLLNINTIILLVMYTIKRRKTKS